MKSPLHAAARVAIAICAWLGSSAVAAANGSLSDEIRREAIVIRATGTFDVKLTPQANETPTEGSPLGRMSIEKQFRGDLEGTSKGEMLTAMTAIQNSAAYVAVERVTGTLHGKRGTFALHHTGVMDRGAQKLTIAVVPDSGTGELTGITGTMTIEISGGKHSYVFEYTLPSSR